MLGKDGPLPKDRDNLSAMVTLVSHSFSTEAMAHDVSIGLESQAWLHLAMYMLQCLSFSLCSQEVHWLS